ncbi:hypothetical protein [Calothrix sp. PCC 6303]|nr:hypothetical protein [Calothrix sp. PCC 6303]
MRSRLTGVDRLTQNQAIENSRDRMVSRWSTVKDAFSIVLTLTR